MSYIAIYDREKIQNKVKELTKDMPIYSPMDIFLAMTTNPGVNKPSKKTFFKFLLCVFILFVILYFAYHSC